MALTEYNFTPGVNRDGIVLTQTVTAVAGAATTLGGTYGLRLLVDDAVTPSKSQLLQYIDILQQRIKQDTWPPTMATNAG